MEITGGRIRGPPPTARQPAEPPTDQPFTSRLQGWPYPPSNNPIMPPPSSSLYEMCYKLPMTNFVSVKPPTPGREHMLFQ